MPPEAGRHTGSESHAPGREHYGGPERREHPRPDRVFVTSNNETNWLRKAEALGPMLVIAAGGLIAYGGFDVRMSVVEDALARLQDMPLQVERLRTDLREGTMQQNTDLRALVSGLEHRVAVLESRQWVESP